MKCKCGSDLRVVHLFNSLYDYAYCYKCGWRGLVGHTEECRKIDLTIQASQDVVGLRHSTDPPDVSQQDT